jgi:hypothetical protein
MKLLFIACLALSTTAFADSTSSSMKTTTSKKAYVPSTSEVDHDGSMGDAKVEVQKETETYKNRSQKMEDENHMPTDTSTTTERTTIEEE